MEAGIAAPSAGSTSPSSATSNTSSQATQTITNEQSKAQQTQNSGGAPTRGADGKFVSQKGGQPQAKQESVEDDSEEVRIGSVSAKVPKALAKAVKDLERGFHSNAQKAATFEKFFGNASPRDIAMAAKDNDFFAEWVLKTKGIDPDQYSQARLAKKLEMELMDPKEREAMEYKRKLDEYEAREREKEEQSKAERQQQLETQEAQRLRQQLVDCWKDSGLPPDPKFGAWIAATWNAAKTQGLNWTWEQCAARVKSDFTSHVRRVVHQMDPQGIQELIGDEPLKKWREYEVQRVTQAASPSDQAKNRPGKSPASESKASKPMNEKEYREYWKTLTR